MFEIESLLAVVAVDDVAAAVAVAVAFAAADIT